MKKYNLNNNEHVMIITSSAILTGTLMLTTLSSCSRINKETDNSMSRDINISSESESSISSEHSTSSENTTTESYDFTWEHYDTEQFEKIVKNEFGTSIRRYIVYYGFTDEFSNAFTKYVNSKWNTNYKSVPFKKANYFFDHIMSIDDVRHRYDSYDNFKLKCLDNEKDWLSIFNNKLIMSYLIQNQIPFGERIQVDNFKSLMGEKSYVYNNPDEILVANPKTGNYNNSYKYNKLELNELLIRYNAVIFTLAADNSIKTGNLSEKPEVVELYNQHLKKFYGENAPQIGQVMTKEQYIAIFGEEPLDISYISGAIMQTPQETMASPVSYIDYDNYNVYYNPNYDMTGEDDRGRSR